MVRNRNREFFGAFLILLGVLFLLVNNDLIWFGWEAIWPILLFLLGLFTLRMYAVRKRPGKLFGGVFFTLLGIFLFVFSSGILDWSRLDTLWPTFLLVPGIALISVAVVKERSSTPFVGGVFLLVFSVVFYVTHGSEVMDRVFTPLARLWPLVLILSGLLVFLRARRERLEESPGMVRRGTVASAAGPLGSMDEVAAKVKRAARGDAAIRCLVGELKRRFEKFSWVGVYRLEGDTMTLGDTHFAGTEPEHRSIRMPEGICGLAAGTRETVIVPDVRENERYIMCSPSTRSEMVVPILKEGVVFGVLDINSSHLDAFRSDDKQSLESLISQVSDRL
jgi:GAF domain-containing protein